MDLPTPLDTAPHSVLILAPRGRDAEVASTLLRQAGIPARICADIASLAQGVDEDALFAVVTEEELREADLRELANRAGRQPAWSDFQFIVLTQRGGVPDRNPAAMLVDLLRNLSFLERPFHPASFTSLVRTAALSRARQFEARARIEELDEGEMRLRTALSAGRLGSWERDLRTSILTCSDTCKAIFGYLPDERFDYEDLVATIHPDDRVRMDAAVRATITTGADYDIEYRTIWRDGSAHWVAINGRVVRDTKGWAVRLVGVSADITARKQAEETQRRLNETLEARVAERTAALEEAHRVVLAESAQREQAEAQLRQAQKMEVIGQLTGGVAHDFNNLLMAIIANLELLEKHDGHDARSRRLLDGAMKGAQRGAALTQRLLAFARKQDLTVESRRLTDLVRGMTDLLERSLGPTIELDLDLPDDAPPALLDVNQVELAVLNLAVNARDAMPHGGRLRIAVDRIAVKGPDTDPAPGDYLRLTVGDTGHGMSAETLKKATEPFFSTKGVGKGTGLGLSMIHGLAVQLNGALRLSSIPGEGTRAELLIPMADETQIPLEPTPASTAVAAPATAIRARILAVDDDMLISMSTVEMLEDLGHDVLEANSGEEALRILRGDGAVDLLLTDFSMPRMNGAQLAEAALAMRPGLPILIATGYAELPSGGSLNLPRLGKPYQQAQLEAEIQKLLRKSD